MKIVNFVVATSLVAIAVLPATGAKSNELQQCQKAKNAAIKCMTHALEKEAADQGILGKRAIAENIIHRRNDSRYPGTICEVVAEVRYVERWEKYVPQYSFLEVNQSTGQPYFTPLSGSPESIEESFLIAEAQLENYCLELDGEITPVSSNYIGGATMYYAPDAMPLDSNGVRTRPSWDWSCVREVITIKGHIFYEELC